MLPLGRLYLLHTPRIESRVRFCENVASYSSRRQLWLSEIAFILERFTMHQLYGGSRPTTKTALCPPCASQLKSQQHVRVHLALRKQGGWGATARTFQFCRWGRWCQVAEAAAVSGTSGWSTCAAVIITLFSPPFGKSTALGLADKRSNFSYRLCLKHCQTHSVSHNAPLDFLIWQHTSNFHIHTASDSTNVAEISHFSNAYF